MNGYKDDLFFADVETTGLSPKGARVLEVCFSRVSEPNGWATATVTTFRFRAPPEVFKAAHPKALAANGYMHDHPDWKDWPLMGTTEARASWEAVREAAKGALLINQNVGFDRGFMWSEFFHHGLYAVPTEVEAEELGEGATSEEARAQVKIPWLRHCVDVQTYSRAFAKRYRSPNFRLATIYDALGGPALPPHRAEADVLRAMWVYGSGEQRFAKDYPVEARTHDAVRRLIAQGAGVTGRRSPG